MDPITGTFVVNDRDNGDFAALSGDFNPLHVDATYARRLQFGSAVVHGVHHLLRSLDLALGQSDALSADQVRGLSVAFPNPLRANQEVEYALRCSDDAQSAQLVGLCSGRRVLAVTLTLGEPMGNMDGDCKVDGRSLESVSPIDQLFPPEHSSGRVPLRCDPQYAHRLFPCLSTAWGLARLAQVLACTNVVGMQCPGLNSVFTGLDLSLDASGCSADVRDCLSYEAVHTDARFELVRLQVVGACVSGTLETFFRPAPTPQIDFQSALAASKPSEFASQNALIVGGSRGIGETTAKILAAGGASVCISYNAGHEDALAVQRDIVSGGGNCTHMQLDVCGDVGDLVARIQGEGAPNHVYYFATPLIEPNKSRGWNVELFTTFTRMYLSAFSQLVDQVMASRKRDGEPVTFYYPSSVFVNSPQKGFAEYAVAKAAGENLCRQLAMRHKDTRFITPRLPRMATDQTSSIMAVECESTFDVMSRELREMYL
jgi:acyl dehydratase